MCVNNNRNKSNIMFFILATAMLLSGVFQAASSDSAVIIVGAGAAGIAAASKLLNNNITNIQILEAEDRIGGRIFSVPVQDYYVDLGAESVHGKKGNAVYEMVEGSDLLEEELGENVLWMATDGEVDEDLRNHVLQFIDEFEDQIGSAQGQSTVGKEFLKRYNEIILEKYKNDPRRHKLAVAAIQLAENIINDYEGSYSWNDLAVPNNYQTLDGDLYQYWKGTGYRIILDILMGKKSFKDKIKLSTEVRTINYTDSKVLVKCSDNRIFVGDHVIVTVPLGVLKSKSINFVPELPEDKREAVERMDFGGVYKLILYFPEPWWDNGSSTFSFLWDESERLNIVKQFPEGPQHNGTSWLYYMDSLTTNKFCPNILIAWFSGEVIKEMDTMNDSIVAAGVMYTIEKFLGDRFKITQPTKTYRFRWISNPHFLGTYLYEGPDIFKTAKKYQDVLAYPLLNEMGVPLVLFAGEATHLHFYSTVHGAIETGYREADRIIALRNKTSDNKT